MVCAWDPCGWIVWRKGGRGEVIRGALGPMEGRTLLTNVNLSILLKLVDTGAETQSRYSSAPSLAFLSPGLEVYQWQPRPVQGSWVTEAWTAWWSWERRGWGHWRGSCRSGIWPQGKGSGRIDKIWANHWLEKSSSFLLSFLLLWELGMDILLCISLFLMRISFSTGITAGIPAIPSICLRLLIPAVPLVNATH